MNTVAVVGRLVNEIDLRYIPGSGAAVAKFTIAIDRGLSKAKKEEAQSQGKPTADFLRVIVWNKSAEFISNYASKGALIAVKGSIRTGQYTDKEGRKVYTTEIEADNYNGIEILEWNKSENERKDEFGMKAKEFEGDFSKVDDEEFPIPF